MAMSGDSTPTMTFRARDRHTDMTAPELTDEAAFAELVERHRRELLVHCYRMTGSLDEAEDLTQEAFLRAWRGRETYAGRASLRAWLYRIATNACLDALQRRPRVPTESGEVAWLQPIPDALLADVPAADAEPDAEVVARETIELAYMVAIQHLPPRTRAVLILRDVLGWRAREAAELLDTSVAAVNSALQRARAGLKEHLPAGRNEWSVEAPSAEQRALLERYMAATESGDVEALATTLADDLRFTMPPEPGVLLGRDEAIAGWIAGGFGDSQRFGDFRCLLTSANRQPAVANYLRRPGSGRFEASMIDVLTVRGGEVTEIVTFSAKTFGAFGLPDVL
jgi:RNA polymerase sigma-70 factor (TIGR02960 family)